MPLRTPGIALVSVQSMSNRGKPFQGVPLRVVEHRSIWQFPDWPREVNLRGSVPVHAQALSTLHLVAVAAAVELSPCLQSPLHVPSLRMRARTHRHVLSAPLEGCRVESQSS